MRRRGKVALGVLAALVALLGANALLTSAETEPAEVTVAGGRILDLPGGDIQVLDRGPRRGAPIVLIHGFTGSIDWWEATMRHLEARHRVVALDALGHGGSEKPREGYAMEDQAELVAEVLRRLGVRDATVVGHSMGAVLGIALAESAPGRVSRVVVLGQAPDSDGYGADLPLTAALTFQPVVGEALWRLAPDFSIEGGLSVGFAPGYDVPDEFVEGFRRLTYTAYDESAEEETDYTEDEPLDSRLARIGKPVLAIFGAEEQIYDPRASLAAYRAGAGAETALVAGAGHSPNVERPRLTARLIERFTKKGRPEGRPK